jgi:prepilin-type N-terminal cleavage/methylation domain-containing protein
MHIKRANMKGLTLVELLMVTAMLSIVSLAIFSTFSSGLRIWQRVNTKTPYEDLGIFFDKFSGDLRNSFKFKGLRFSGGYNSFGFPTLLDNRVLNVRTVGEVTYSYDFNKEAFNRNAKDFSQAFSNGEGAEQQLNNVKSLRFQYYAFDTEKKVYAWQDEWLEEEPPLAVKI